MAAGGAVILKNNVLTTHLHHSSCGLFWPVRKDSPLAKTRLLFVDDETSIRLTLPRILESRGFDVTVASTVPEALAAIQSKKFDVLLSDLNVGNPGDGFTIVSAMLRTQPEATTLIITGFPSFA